MTRRRPVNCRRLQRTGMISLEIVLTTALLFPMAVGLLYLAIRGASLLYHMITALVAWPHL